MCKDEGWAGDKVLELLVRHERDWERTFCQFQLACGFQCAGGVFGEVVEDDGGGHCHGEGGVGVGFWFWGD
jgi:hypothetical protein